SDLQREERRPRPSDPQREERGPRRDRPAGGRRRGGGGSDEPRRSGGSDESRRSGGPRAGEEAHREQAHPGESPQGGKSERPRGDQLTLRVKIERVSGDERPRGRAGGTRPGSEVREGRAADVERRGSQIEPSGATEPPGSEDGKQRPGLLARILSAFRR